MVRELTAQQASVLVETVVNATVPLIASAPSVSVAS